MLTAQDVEQKTFSTALRGYDLDEVDDFLDEIVSTLKQLNEQLEEAKGTQTPLLAPAPEPVAEEADTVASELEPEPEPEPMPAPVLDESAVGRALIAAQTAADKLLADAESAASRIVDDAREQAETWESEKESKRAQAQQEMANLAERVRAVRSELSVLAEQVSGNLDDMDSVIASSGVIEIDEDEGERAGPTGVVETEYARSETGEVETGSDDTDTANGAAHLDQILTGVTSDLQLGDSDEESDDDEHHHDGESDEDEEGDEDRI